MSQPTFLQTLFNQPSQKYATSAPRHPHIARSSSTTSSSHNDRLAYASEKLAVFTRPTRDPPSPASDTDSADDMFFTPLTSPVSEVPSLPSLSSASSAADDDDLFSSRSAATSITSISAPSSKPRKAPRSRPPNVAEWSRGVRWLVPPDSMRPQQSTAAIIRSLDLVDVEYAAPKSRKSGRSSRQTDSERMSALMEEEEDDDHAPASQHSRPRTAPSPRRMRTASLSAASTRTVVIPSPLPVSAGPATSSGYTSLTLPRAAYTPTKPRVSSSVDITRSGLAQTTMATIAITTRPRSATPAHLRDTLPSPLAFTSHTAPPGKVNAREVLVQVWAVALDTLDAVILDERAARNDGLGFVPGRSFVGRAIECGWEVNSVSRGDWVVGITDIRKCGALAEFIVVDRRRLHRAPHPSPQLSLEQLAILPLAGVPAHRAVRTFAHLPRDARALVLHAHEGPGLLAAQELSALGIRVVAQVPGPWGSPAEKRARTAGARDVRCGAATAVVQDIAAAEFDGVLDPLGGKDVWAACRRVLRPAGQFTTLVGDAGALGVNAHFKSTMRSLSRAFAQRVGYQWVSPAADVDHEGADVRDSLAAVVRLAAEGVFDPYVANILPLERAPSAFTPDLSTTVIRIID